MTGIPRQLWLCSSIFSVQNASEAPLVNESHNRSSLRIPFVAWSQPHPTRSPLGPPPANNDIYIIESPDCEMWLVTWLIRLSQYRSR